MSYAECRIPCRPSLHAFFKRKSPSSSSPTKSPVSTSKVKSTTQSADFRFALPDDAVVDLTGSSPPAKKGKLQDGTAGGANGTDMRRTLLTQPTSAYFSKGKKAGSRPPLGEKLSSNGNEMDVDGADEDQPGPSRRVTLVTEAPYATKSAPLENYRLPKRSAPRFLQSGSAFENNSYDIAGPSNSHQADPFNDHQLPPASQGRTAEQERRHEEWQRRVMAPGGIVSRRRSLALDEAAAAEARRQAGGDPDGEDGVDTPIVEDDGADEEEEGRKAAEGVGSRLKEKYAAEGGETGKGKAKGKSKKKEEEVGPSGQTFTPLEKQFMEIKAENPDVLLLMEGILFSLPRRGGVDESSLV